MPGVSWETSQETQSQLVRMAPLMNLAAHAAAVVSLPRLDRGSHGCRHRETRRAILVRTRSDGDKQIGGLLRPIVMILSTFSTSHRFGAAKQSFECWRDRRRRPCPVRPPDGSNTRFSYTVNLTDPSQQRELEWATQLVVRMSTMQTGSPIGAADWRLQCGPRAAGRVPCSGSGTEGLVRCPTGTR